MNDTTCEVCQTDISHLGYRHRLCDDCKRGSHKTVRTHTCEECGAQFQSVSSPRAAKKFCGPACRAARHRHTQAVTQTYRAPCSVETCTTPVRSARAIFCEKHYMRNRRHGSPLATQVREPTGTCIHCEAAAPEGKLFCSDLCARRDAHGIPHTDRYCVWCDCKLPRQRRWDARTCGPACTKRVQRVARYGLSPEVFREILRRQGGVCAICASDGGCDGELLVVDHDHAAGTDAVRGLLCAECNSGIGMLKDSPEVLKAAARYLLESKGASHGEVLAD